MSVWELGFQGLPLWLEMGIVTHYAAIGSLQLVYVEHLSSQVPRLLMYVEQRLPPSSPANPLAPTLNKPSCGCCPMSSWSSAGDPVSGCVTPVWILGRLPPVSLGVIPCAFLLRSLCFGSIHSNKSVVKELYGESCPFSQACTLEGSMGYLIHIQLN